MLVNTVSPSNTDTIGTEESVLIKEVSSFKTTAFGETSVLIREVYLIQGCSLRGVPLFSVVFALV